MRNLLALLLLPPMCATAQLPDYVPTDGLVGWWPFEGSALDASGNGNHGLMDGDPALLPSFVYDSVLDRDVIQFDDTDDELTIPAPNQLGLNNEFSFACWLTPNEENHGQVMSMDNGRFSFFLHGANDHFDAVSTTSWASEAYYCGWDNYPYTHPDGWFHMTITISSDSIKAYGNGELITALDCGGQSSFDTNLIFGFRNMNSSGDYHWGGSLANCGVWNRPLTDLEVESLFDQTSPISGCTDPTACNYDESPNANDGSCEYGCLYCGEGTVWDSTLAQCISIAPPCAPSCGEGTVWDPINEECIIAIPADLNYDGCVTVNDLLVLLAVHGTCPPYPEWPEEPTDSSDCPPGAFDQLQQDLNGEGWSWLGEYNTAQYFVSTNPISWDNAQSLAVAYGGHLVVIESQDENDWISTSVGDEYVWIGLYQDTSSAEYSEPAGGWAWVNGAEVTYSNWAGNAPNEVNGLENACQMYSNGLWNDAPGDYFLDGSDGRDIYAVMEFSSACPAPDWTCGDPLTYWDYDYATVLIGDQCWFAENLRSSQYRNGESIPTGIDDANWGSLETGATAVYGEGSSPCNSFGPIDACNDTIAFTEYGRMYNWHAVTDNRGICPSGWHVPSGIEWTALENFLISQGHSGQTGGVLKSETGWTDSGGGTNDYGFSAFPSGVRGINGSFLSAGLIAYWWSSSHDGVTAETRFIDWDETILSPWDDWFEYGLAVRCLID